MARIKMQEGTTLTFAGFIARHNEAIDRPKGFEVPIVRMLHFWEMYAVEHKQRWESIISEDYVLRENWLDIARGIRGLLNGETGRLDCGTLDGFIVETARENGIDDSEL